jgi:hypothetical protein
LPTRERIGTGTTLPAGERVGTGITLPAGWCIRPRLLGQPGQGIGGR